MHADVRLRRKRCSAQSHPINCDSAQLMCACGPASALRGESRWHAGREPLPNVHFWEGRAMAVGGYPRFTNVLVRPIPDFAICRAILVRSVEVPKGAASESTDGVSGTQKARHGGHITNDKGRDCAPCVCCAEAERWWLGVSAAHRCEARDSQERGKHDHRPLGQRGDTTTTTTTTTERDVRERPRNVIGSSSA